MSIHPSIIAWLLGSRARLALLTLAHARARWGPDTTPGYTDPGRDWPITQPRHEPEGGARWIVYIGSGQASSFPTYPFIYEASQPASLRDLAETAIYPTHRAASAFPPLIYCELRPAAAGRDFLTRGARHRFSPCPTSSLPFPPA